MGGLLIINRVSSECGECGKSCSPREKSHDTILGWGDNNGSPGCGVTWDKVTSAYAGKDIETAVRALRPDLEWVPITETSFFDR